MFNRLLKRTGGHARRTVDDEIANQLCAQLLYLEGEDQNQDIWLYVSSPGGSVTAGMAIYDTMQFVGCDSPPCASAWLPRWAVCHRRAGKRSRSPTPAS